MCTILLVPLKERLIERRRTLGGAAIQFFITTVFVCMIMELAMGFMLNRPDAAGVYPLWDNSQLPLNVFGQAWLVNDLFLGAVAMLYTWILYPLFEKGLRPVPPRVMNVLSFVIVVSFVVLCIMKFM